MRAVFLDHCAEVWSLGGPTGRFARVLSGEVRDAGGNVLFAGSADDCVAFGRRSVPHLRLVPVTWEPVPEEVAGATHNWQCVVE